MAITPELLEQTKKALDDAARIFEAMARVYARDPARVDDRDYMLDLARRYAGLYAELCNA